MQFRKSNDINNLPQWSIICSSNLYTQQLFNISQIMIYFLTTTATKNQYAIKNSDAFMINKIIYKESIWSSQRKIHYILFSILLLYWSYINAGVFLGYPYDFFIIRRKDMFEKRESGLKHIYGIFKYFWSKYADLFLIKLMGKYI